MNLHRKKMIAPIVVSIIIILYYAVYFGILITLLDGIWKYVLGISWSLDLPSVKRSESWILAIPSLKSYERRKRNSTSNAFSTDSFIRGITTRKSGKKNRVYYELYSLDGTQEVPELLGHSAVSTTMNIYAHATREAKKNSARLLDKVAGND